MGDTALDTILVSVLAFCLVGAPALALSFRIALKPAVEALVELREAFDVPSGGSDDPDRLRALEAEVRMLRMEIDALSGSVDDRDRLEGE